LFDSSLSPTILTAQFLLGPKPELRSAVELQLLDSVAKAAILAAVQEQFLDRGKKGNGKWNSLKQSQPPDSYEAWILQTIVYRIPGYVSDTDTRWIRLGYISVEYPKKINANRSDTFSNTYWTTMAH
jgi:hypothetical protein